MTKNPPPKNSTSKAKASGLAVRPATTPAKITKQRATTSPASKGLAVQSDAPKTPPKASVNKLAPDTKSVSKAPSSKAPVNKAPVNKASVSKTQVSKATAKQVLTKRSLAKKAPRTVTTWPGAGNEDNTIRVRKAGEVVAERFRRQIANGTLVIGHQLPSEEELTTMFGIARTTLREALRVLESQGLLEIKRGRGGGGIITMPRLDNLSQSLALVLQLQHTTLGDLDDARMMIEPPLAGRLASQHSDEDLEVLSAIVDRAHECAEADDKNGFGKAAAMLHEAIIERGGNNTMAVIGALLHDLMDRHFHSAAEISDHEQMSRAVRSYRKLIDLIESGDAAAATAHWHRQLVYLQQRRASIQLLDIFND